MTTIILSDTHLTPRFEPKKFDYLVRTLQQADQVVINGDFWDGFVCSFDTFLTSEWRHLFPILRAKGALYLYGNHDTPDRSDARVSWFSAQVGRDTTLELGGQSFYVTHGNAIVPSLEERYGKILNNVISLRIGATIDKLHKQVWGRQFLLDGNDINAPMKAWIPANLPGATILVCGHSHYPEFSLEERYLNSGFIGAGFGQYLKLTEDEIDLVRERY